MKEFKIRASASWKLMTAPRSKTESLSETTKTYLKEWAIEQIYGIRKEIKSKYITKGLKLEDEGIDKAIEWLDLEFVLKNEQYYEDDYFCGTPDIVTDDEVLDIKISYTPHTFPLFEEKIPTIDYKYQVNVYMHLTGKKKARVVYLLLETPPELNYGEVQDYSELDLKYRFKTFHFDYDETIIKELQKKVEESRCYLEKICIFTNEIRQD